MASLWTLIIAVQVILATLYFLSKKRRSEKSYDPLCNGQPITWKAQPLGEPDVIPEEPPVMGKIDENVLNVGTTSFLCLDKEESIINSSLDCLDKYGLGSCGPRVLFGTTDVHLELENRMSRFLDVEEVCVYSHGFSTVASVVPCYAKSEDILFADENVWFAIQKGIEAARCTVHYFKHNDMNHLEEILWKASKNKELNPKRRAFIVAEGIYLNTGEICPLKRLVQLARKYKLRIMLDESLSIGVLGKHGKGLTEHLGVPQNEIDLIIGSLEHSFATIGGFCAGAEDIVMHQRMASAGYVFSASMPPMLSQAAISGLDVLEAKPHIISELEENSRKFNKALSKLKYYRVRGDEISPVKHIYLKKEDLTDSVKNSYLRNISNYCLEKGVAVTPAAYLRDIELNCPEPSIRLTSSRKLNDSNISLICSLLDEAYEKVGPGSEQGI